MKIKSYKLKWIILQIIYSFISIFFSLQFVIIFFPFLNFFFKINFIFLFFFFILNFIFSDSNFHLIFEIFHLKPQSNIKIYKNHEKLSNFKIITLFDPPCIFICHFFRPTSLQPCYCPPKNNNLNQLVQKFPVSKGAKALLQIDFCLNFIQ